MADLPKPATVADEYLYDIALSLRALNDTLAALQTAMTTADAVSIMAAEDRLLAPIPLREPSQRKQHKGPA